jgi:O-antigen/teichoic acid export membrane protein
MVILLAFMREFIRFAMFVYMRPMAVLIVDAVYGSLLLSSVYFVTREGSAVALHAIVAMGVAGLGAGIVGLTLFHRYIGWTFSWDPALLTITWKHGKWALMGVIVTWLHNEGFLYMLAGLKGAIDVAHVSASRLLFVPTKLMLSGFDAILKPRGAAWLARGEERRMQQSIILLTGGSLVVALLYICCLLLVQKSLTVFLFREEITGMSSLFTLWGTVSLLVICRSNLSIILQIFERFSTLFYIGTVSAVASLSVGYWAIHTVGVLGSLVGLIVGEMVYLIGMGWWVYVRHGVPWLSLVCEIQEKIRNRFVTTP